MEKALKLFVWEDVLRDYTSGIMFALAETADEARQLILKREPYCKDYVRSELAKEPEVYETKKGFILYGGG